MFNRSRIIVVLAALVLSVGLATGLSSSAHANTTQEQYLYYTPQWCATTTGNSPYAPIVLGACNDGAASQQFYLRGESGNTFEIVSKANGLCDTYNQPNGAPDGAPIIEGNCANAATQRWAFLSGPSGGNDKLYWLPGRTDNHGNFIAIDDANDVLKPFNKFVGSFRAQGYNSENFSTLYLG
jgi:hypothetical protein